MAADSFFQHKLDGRLSLSAQCPITPQTRRAVEFKRLIAQKLNGRLSLISNPLKPPHFSNTN